MSASLFKYIKMMDDAIKKENLTSEGIKSIAELVLDKVSPQNNKKTRLTFPYFNKIDYKFSVFQLKCIKAIDEDEEYKNNIADTRKKDLEILKIIKAREEDFHFEEKISEIICGDNNLFPYKTGKDLTDFFHDLGFYYIYDGKTRKWWVCDILKISNSYQLHKFLTEGVFKKKYFINSGKDVDLAKEELKKLIDDSCQANDVIDISDTFGLNISNEILFNEEIKTSDTTLNELINESKELFIRNNKQLALEKIWDAFERIKTIYIDLDKKSSVKKVCNTCSTSLNYDSINSEFTELTNIGNDYQIRHFETNKKTINDINTKTYLYFRMLSLINFVTKQLELI